MHKSVEWNLTGKGEAQHLEFSLIDADKSIITPICPPSAEASGDLMGQFENYVWGLSFSVLWLLSPIYP